LFTANGLEAKVQKVNVFSEDRIHYSFQPYYPLGYKWDMACQRGLVPSTSKVLNSTYHYGSTDTNNIDNSNNNNVNNMNNNQTDFMYDIDYMVDPVYQELQLRVSFPYDLKESKRVLSRKTYWISIGFPVTVNEDGKEQVNGDFVVQHGHVKFDMHRIHFSRSLCFMSYAGWFPGGDELLVVGHLNHTFSRTAVNSTTHELSNSHIQFSHWYNLTDDSYFTRSECYDFNNMRFYAQMRNWDRSVDMVILHVIAIMTLVLFMLAFISLYGGELIKRRFFTSVLSQILIIVSMGSQTVPACIFWILHMRKSINVPSSQIVESIASVGGNASLQLALVLYCYKMFRFFQLRYVYRKMFRSGTKTKDNRLYHLLVSKWGYRIMFLIGAIIVGSALVGLVVLCFYAKRRSDPFWYENDREIAFFLDVGILSFLLLIYLAEAVINFKTLFKKGLKYFYVSDDPMLYRLEAWITLAIMSLYLCYEFIPFYLAPTYFGVLLGELHFYGTMWGYQVCFGSGSIMVIEIFRLLKKIIWSEAKPKVQESDLVRLLYDERFRTLFDDYCLKEYSSENLALFFELQSLRFGSGIMSHSKYMEMYSTYITPQATLQVNMSSRTSKICQEIVQITEDVVTFEQLQPLYNDTVMNLSETYVRFSVTTEYAKYMEMKNIMKEEFFVELNEPLLL